MIIRPLNHNHRKKTSIKSDSTKRQGHPTLRIVSLVPSLTKTMVDGGLKNAIVGCTSFCVDPPDLWRTAAICGGTKNPDIAKILSLRPTHILVNHEENRNEDVEVLANHAKIVATFPKSPFDVPDLLKSLAGEFGSEVLDSKASLLASRLSQLSSIDTSQFEPRGYLYFIWKDPYMVAGEDTYISRLLSLFNLRNSCHHDLRYPALTPDEIKTSWADLWLLASEPYPFRNRDAQALKSLITHADVKIEKIDGKLVSWWGTLTIEALDMLSIRFANPC